MIDSTVTVEQIQAAYATCQPNRMTDCGCLTEYNLPANVIKLNNGVQFWNDRDYVVSNVPEFLQNADLIQQPHEISGQMVFQHSPSYTGDVYIFNEVNHEKYMRNGGLPASLTVAGWTKLDEKLSWDDAELEIWKKSFINIDLTTVKLTDVELVGGIALDLDCPFVDRLNGVPEVISPVAPVNENSGSGSESSSS